MKETTHYILTLLTYHILLAIILATLIVACCNSERVIALGSLGAHSLLRLLWWLLRFEDDSGGEHFEEDQQ